MAFRTFQLCLVFAIGLYQGPANASTVLSGSASLAGANSLNSVSNSNQSSNSHSSSTTISTSVNSGTSSAPTGGNITLSLLVEDPQDVIATRGQGVHLKCPVQEQGPGKKGFQISWMCDGIIVNNSDSRRQIQKDGSLFIRKVVGKRVSSVEGNYNCLVRNHYGAIATNPAKLQIAMLAKNFLKQPENVKIEVSQPFRLSCQIMSIPSAIINWERNGNVLPYSTRYVLLPSGDLIISMTQKSDSGTYRCKAVNAISKKHRYSNEAIVHVVHNSSMPHAPKFLVFSHEFNLTVHAGADLPLHCFATGYPRPTIKWTSNIVNSHSQILSNASLFWLRNLTTAHSGVYACNAQNTVGQITQYFNVVVIQAPYFLKTPMSQWFPSARTVRLDCKAEGIPSPQIRWLKDGEPLSLEGRIKMLPSSVLLLSHTFTTDSGLYQCIAENEFGRIWSAAQLIANISEPQPVSPPMNVRCNPYNKTSICLKWDVPPGVEVQAFTVHSYNADLGKEYITNETYFLVSKLEPLINYTFYIRLYMKSSSSDQSKEITCQTTILGTRDLNMKALSNSSLRVEWTSLSSDTPCGGIAEYKLQWRKYGHASNNAKLVFDNYFTITGLIPSQKYEIRVQSPNNEDEELPWEEYVMPNNYDNIEIDSTTSEIPKNVLAPVQLEAEPLSSSSINLTWKDPRSPDNILDGGYYMICYTEVKLQQSCENGLFMKSISTSIEINNLTPYTLYEFKVRSHNLDGSYGQFSHSVECRTLEYVPNKITNLIGKLENISSICLRWRKPNVINGQLQRYVVSYSSQNQTLDKWPSVVLLADQVKSQSCWRSSADSVSMHLKTLQGGKTYKVVVRAATNAGLSPPSDPINIKIPLIAKPPPQTDELQSNQKLGIIMGVCIAIIVIIACISCMVFRRRCLKARAREHARMYAPRATNGQSTLYCQSFVQPVGAVSSRTQCQSLESDRERQQCEAEAHELQYLVTETEPYVPPSEPEHLDTKGSASFPNGQANSVKQNINGHVPNGHVHITENPQFESYNYSDIYNGSSDSYQLLHIDRNSNQDDTLLDDTLNTTQLTNLEESLSIAAVRTLSPVLGPNG